MFGLPIYATRKTYEAVKSRIGGLEHVNYFRAGSLLRFGDASAEFVRARGSMLRNGMNRSGFSKTS